jgi:Na+/H+-translocating membrane pyrophosphatase
MAISYSNLIGAWIILRNSLKMEVETSKFDESYGSFIEDIKNEDLVNIDSYRKGTKPHQSAAIGTVGDPLKDISGFSLNILIRLCHCFIYIRIILCSTLSI